MNFQRFIAPTATLALEKAKQILGDDAIILSNKTTESGVELIVTSENIIKNFEEKNNQEIIKKLNKPRLILSKTEKNNLNKSKLIENPKQNMSTLSFQDFVRDRMLKKRANNSALINNKIEPSFIKKQEIREINNQQNLIKIDNLNQQNNLNKNQLILPNLSKNILNEFSNIKFFIEEKFNSLNSIAWINQAQKDQDLNNLILRLINCGFSPILTRKILENVPNNLIEFNKNNKNEINNEKKYLNWIIQVLQNNIKNDFNKSALYEKGGTFALVGSNGVGKTTTIAKLAALGAKHFGAENIALINLDFVRPASYEQLRAYARMFNIALHQAKDKIALKELLNLLTNKKLVLIDTAGFSSKDIKKQINFSLLNEPQIEQILVLNASSQAETLEENLKSYKSEKCQKVILSKLDETNKLGTALDVLIRNPMEICGLTNGTKVPQDFIRLETNNLILESLKTQRKTVFTPTTSDLSFIFA